MLGAMFSTQFGTAFAKSLFPAVGAIGVTTLRVTMAALMLTVLWRPWRNPPKRARPGRFWPRTASPSA